ncbi:MAG TPA: hypothetical protein VGO24_04605 [Solirubrobacterales bacterium]|jgi:hypothetical protein|nr:hypothetical protein [Solirubrobacterales bacterium]
MIRQAHTYLVGAMSGATLIAIAIVAFVLLVSAQVFRDWPIAALGDSGSPHISDARTASPAAAAGTATAPAGAGAAKSGSSGSGASAKGAGKAKPSVAGGDLATSEDPTGPAEAPSGGEGGGPGDSGNQAGSNPPTSSPAGSAPGPSGQGSSPSSPGGGSSSGGGTASTPSAKVTETVNNTVNQVDETVAGGSLGKTGVTEAAQGVVNGVAGPESPVGKVVDETVKTVGGLLGAKP